MKDVTRIDRRDALKLVGASTVFIAAGCKGNPTTAGITAQDAPMNPPSKPNPFDPTVGADAILKVSALGFPWETSDPFLFCAHHVDHYPAGNANLGVDTGALGGRDMGSDFVVKDGFRMYHGKEVPGFPRHPHRGFETVTLVRQGLVDHSDSLGATARFGNGDAQWLTAGGGINHAEMFPLLNRDSGNTGEVFQVWLNLPKKNKMVPAYFSMLWDEAIPRVLHRDAAGKTTEVTTVAGHLGDKRPPNPPPHSWANEANSDVAIWTITMQPGATWTLPAAQANTGRSLYFFEGSGLQVGGKTIADYHRVELQGDRAVALVAGDTPVQVLLLQGQPIKEPVSRYGPFVMNTRSEIRQAYDDYQRTGFGGWPHGSNDPVHPATKDRFARHADGREEKPA